MRILVTNDDGIRAPGIEILANWARKIGDVTVVAPKVEQSAKSHSINIHTAFEVKKVSWLDGIDCYSVDSSPSDCIRFAYNGLNMEFDLVLSGINRGFNVGEVGNAEQQVYSETLVVYKDNGIQQAQAVIDAIGIGRAVYASYYYEFEADVLVIIGSDYMPTS